MTESNQNVYPMRSHRHFDFDAFDSLITTALKEGLAEIEPIKETEDDSGPFYPDAA